MGKKAVASKLKLFISTVKPCDITLFKIDSMVAFTTKKVRFAGTNSSSEVPLLRLTTTVPHTTYAVVLPNTVFTLLTMRSRRYSWKT
jgi:hypothetical protein